MRRDTRRRFVPPPLDQLKAKAINYYMAYGNLGNTIGGFVAHMKKYFHTQMGGFSEKTIHNHLKKALGLKKR